MDVNIVLFLERLKYSYLIYLRNIINDRKIGKYDKKSNNLCFLASSYLEILDRYFLKYEDLVDSNFYTEDEIQEILDHFNRIINTNHSFKRLIPTGIGYMIIEKDFIVR